jgi:hypothetical protein
VGGGGAGVGRYVEGGVEREQLGRGMERLRASQRGKGRVGLWGWWLE